MTAWAPARSWEIVDVAGDDQHFAGQGQIERGQAPMRQAGVCRKQLAPAPVVEPVNQFRGAFEPLARHHIFEGDAGRHCRRIERREARLARESGPGEDDDVRRVWEGVGHAPGS